MNRIYIIIPVFNGWPQTKKCLGALRKSNYKDIGVIVIDHGSTDETKEALPRDYPEVTHLLGDSKLWWAGATNLGIKYALKAGAKYVILLNNDCYINDSTINTLMSHMNSLGDNVIIAPVQKDFFTNKIITIPLTTMLLFGFPSWGGPLNITPKMKQKKIIPVTMIGGGRGVIIPARVFGKVGLLDDENLPHYYADHDFYFRCMKKGISLYAAIDAVVYVDGSKTSQANNPEKLSISEFYTSLSDRKSHRNVKDLRELFKKHYPIKRLYYIGVVLNVARYIVVYAIKRTKYLLFGRATLNTTARNR